jgi:hypothetical protein
MIYSLGTTRRSRPGGTPGRLEGNKMTERKIVNGKKLTVKQTEKFDYFMATSEKFRTRVAELSGQVSK